MKMIPLTIWLNTTSMKPLSRVYISKATYNEGIITGGMFWGSSGRRDFER